MTYNYQHEDRVWRALGDRRRRQILEQLVEGPKLTGELVEMFPSLGRTAVLRHLSLLIEADLIIVKPDGRKRWNRLNDDPIQSICSGWIQRHFAGIRSSVSSLKGLAESVEKSSQTGDLL